MWMTTNAALLVAGRDGGRRTLNEAEEIVTTTMVLPRGRRMSIVSVDVDDPQRRTYGGMRLNIEQKLLKEAALKTACLVATTPFRRRMVE
jgi:hypothetical protein